MAARSEAEINSLLVYKSPARQGGVLYYHAVILSSRIRRLLGDLEGAERDLTRALTLSRRRPEAYITRAWIRLDQNRIAEGLEDAMHARELVTPENKLNSDISELLNQLSSRQCKPLEAGEG